MDDFLERCPDPFRPPIELPIEERSNTMLTWQETVMSEKEVISFLLGGNFTPEIGGRIAQAQAEVTWKTRDPEVIEAKKAGIKEVVEWLNALSQNNWFYTKYGSKDLVIFHTTDMVWRAKLKDWGIE